MLMVCSHLILFLDLYLFDFVIYFGFCRGKWKGR